VAPQGFKLSAAVVDLSSRFGTTSTVVASPAAATETIIASLTLNLDVAVAAGVWLQGWAALTAGTNAVGAQLKLRRTDASGSTLKDSGAVTVVATKLYAPAIHAFDTGPTLPGQVYVLTLTMASGSAESTVSAVTLSALVL
jgi:hypothetical protein